MVGLGKLLGVLLAVSLLLLLYPYIPPDYLVNYSNDPLVPVLDLQILPPICIGWTYIPWLGCVS
jgi:hypothetical protein